MKPGNRLPTSLVAGCQAILIAAVILCGSGLHSSARANLVLNGDFALTSLSSPGGFICQSGSACVSNVTDWSSTCNSGGCGNGATVASLLFSGTSGSAFNGNIGLASVTDPADSSNYIAIDGDATYTATLSQTIAGLTPGAVYQLQFSQAAAQQNDNSGDTTEQWQVAFGSQTQNSTLMDNPSRSFTAWNAQTMQFTASAASEVLTFMALGTPGGEPPVVLLADVSLIQGVPEPASLALIGGALLCLVGARKRVRQTKQQRTSA